MSCFYRGTSCILSLTLLYGSVFLNNCIAANASNYACRQPIIAFAGISGCGKSTLARLVAQQLKALAVHEPEEQDWPAVITAGSLYDQATSFLAFRQIWAKQFTDAHLASQTGKLVLMDSYFFKITSYYLGKPGMEWLVAPSNPYLDLLIMLNKLDQDHFYDADCVVLIDVDLEDWQKFIQARGRNWDQTPGFAESFAVTKEYVERATIAHCERKNIKLIRFQHKFGNPNRQAELLSEQILAFLLKVYPHASLDAIYVLHNKRL